MSERNTRRPYNWGRYDKLKGMQPMTVIRVARGSKAEAMACSSVASRLHRDFGAKYSIRWYKGCIYATRFE